MRHFSLTTAIIFITAAILITSDHSSPMGQYLCPIEKKQVLDLCTIVTTQDMFQRRLTMSRKATAWQWVYKNCMQSLQMPQGGCGSFKEVSDVMQSICTFHEGASPGHWHSRGGDKLQEQEGYAAQLQAVALLAGGPSAFAPVRKELGEEKLAGSLCILVGDDVMVAKKMALVAADALGCHIIIGTAALAVRSSSTCKAKGKLYDVKKSAHDSL